MNAKRMKRPPLPICGKRGFIVIMATDIFAFLLYVNKTYYLCVKMYSENLVVIAKCINFAYKLCKTVTLCVES